MMLLSRLICDAETGGFMLMVDSIQSASEHLLVARIDALLKQNFEVYLYLYETRKHQLFRKFSESVLKRCHVVEYHSDLYGWKDEANGVLKGLPVLPTEKSALNERIAVVMDSLTILLQHYPTQQVCRWLKAFCRKDSDVPNHRQVLAVLHGDLHDETTVSLLEYVADITISVTPTASTISTFDSTAAIQSSSCKIVRKIVGKNPKITNEKFTVDSNLNIQSEEITVKSIKQSTEVIDRKPVANPTENLTFNLKVRQDESEARSRVKLPYTHTSEAVRKDMDAQLDQLDVDDLEEDPDDDLDI